MVTQDIFPTDGFWHDASECTVIPAGLWLAHESLRLQDVWIKIHSCTTVDALDRAIGDRIDRLQFKGEN